MTGTEISIWGRREGDGERPYNQHIKTSLKVPFTSAAASEDEEVVKVAEEGCKMESILMRDKKSKVSKNDKSDSFGLSFEMLVLVSRRKQCMVALHYFDTMPKC